MGNLTWAPIALLAALSAALATVACSEPDKDSSHDLGGAGADNGGAPTDGGGGSAPAAAGAPSCEGLPETQCRQLKCVPIDGVRWPGTLDDPREYAGCATDCSADDCSFPDAEACAVDPSGQCWGLGNPHAPDGWTVLGEYGSCSDLPECTE